MKQPQRFKLQPEDYRTLEAVLVACYFARRHRRDKPAKAWHTAMTAVASLTDPASLANALAYAGRK